MPHLPRVFQINTSGGGVPKLARRDDHVSATGLAHDRQAHTPSHGGTERAVTLFSLERILDLQAEGHPIFPGSIGENITVAGLDWDGVGVGTRLALGDEVVLEISRYASPCSAIAGSFTGGDYGRAAQERHPGSSRLCARVVAEGTVRVGDVVRVLETV